MASNQPVRNRSAITGQYVTAQYARKHPKTTVTEGKGGKKNA